MNKVQLVYNPYKETSRILINGNSISAYSQLANYLQESFEVWSPVILDCIEQELNDDFELEIVSDVFHRWILRELAEKQEACVSVKEEQFPLNQTVLERLEHLKKFAEPEAEPVRVLVYAKDRMLAAVILGELCKTGRYEMQKSALYLSDRKVACLMMTEGDMLPEEPVDLVICIENSFETLNDSLRDIISNFTNTPRMVGIKIEDQLRLKGLENHEYYFGAGIVDISGLIETIVEYLAVVPYMKRKKERMERTGLTVSMESQEMQLDYLIIDAVEPLVMAYCDAELEEGTSMKLHLATFPENLSLPEISVRITNPAVLHYDNGYLYGLMDGETDIEVSVSGSVQPIYDTHIRVKRVIRIKKLYIENSTVILKEGTGTTIGYRFEPQDADNIHEIQWSSSNERIVCVDQNGYIKALKEGTCDIVLQAEQVKEICRVCVKPDMKRIFLPEERVMLSMGQKIPYIADYEPKNCFDNRIFVSIENPEVAGLENGYLVSKGLGKTKVMFHNLEKTAKAVVEVTVESTLYASEKSNIFKVLSFVIGILSIFVLMANKGLGLAGVVLGAVMGGVAVMKDIENVEGLVNVRGEPMQADCVGSIVFILMNVLIGIIAINN